MLTTKVESSAAKGHFVTCHGQNCYRMVGILDALSAMQPESSVVQVSQLLMHAAGGSAPRCFGMVAQGTPSAFMLAVQLGSQGLN